MLNESKHGEVLTETRKRCAGLGIDIRKGFRCRIGGLFKHWSCSSGSHGTSSAVSLSSKVFTTYSLEGYDDPNRRMIADLFRTLIQVNGSLLVLGDSTLEQLAQAITCEAEREGIKDFAWNNVDDFMMGARLDGAPIPFKYHALFKLSHDVLEKLKRTITDLLEGFDRLVVVFNMGLHYNDADATSRDPSPVDLYTKNFGSNEYRQHVSELFHYLSSLTRIYTNKKFIFLWLETGAQHFPLSSGGYFNTSTSASLPSYRLHGAECAPIVDRNVTLDWRNRIVESLLQHTVLFNGSNEFFSVLPFYNITVDMYTFHVNRLPKWIDCTHYW